MVASVIQRGPAQPPDFSDDVAAVAALKDPVRLALYEYVTSQADAVGRDQAAEAIGVNRDMAAFHLDRLADQGLLDVAFRRLSGRQGPGAGRPAKLYSRSAREVQISLPPRRYDVAARLFAEALASKNPAAALGEIARAHGQSLGARALRPAGRRPSAHRQLERAAGVLAEYGYEPSVTGRQVTLRNCPFDALAKDHRPVVCGMNRALIDGLLSGLGAGDLTTVAQDQAGQCCVALSRRAG
jgi:predicted ArsR family transcriptional regulator